MLLTRGKDLHLEFIHIEAVEKTGKAEWVATYAFSKTNRKVVNRIKENLFFMPGQGRHLE
jgi:hypothetical protein